MHILYNEPLRLSNLVVLYHSRLLNSNKISQRELEVILVTMPEKSSCCAVHFLLRLRVLFPLAITHYAVTPKAVCYFFFTRAYAGAWILQSGLSFAPGLLGILSKPVLAIVTN